MRDVSLAPILRELVATRGGSFLFLVYAMSFMLLLLGWILLLRFHYIFTTSRILVKQTVYSSFVDLFPTNLAFVNLLSNLNISAY